MRVEQYDARPHDDIARRFASIGTSVAEALRETSGQPAFEVVISGEPTAIAFEIKVTVDISGATDDELRAFADHMINKGCICQSTGADSASCDCTNIP